MRKQKFICLRFLIDKFYFHSPFILKQGKSEQTMNEQNESQLIDVIIKYPNKEAAKTVITNKYQNISDICQGMIDILSFPFNDEISIICNDEFIHLNMEANLIIPEFDSVLAGPLIFTGFDYKAGDTVSLTDKQTKEVLIYIERHSVQHMRLDEAYLYMKSNYISKM